MIFRGRLHHASIHQPAVVHYGAGLQGLLRRTHSVDPLFLEQGGGFIKLKSPRVVDMSLLQELARVWRKCALPGTSGKLDPLTVGKKSGSLLLGFRV